MTLEEALLGEWQRWVCPWSPNARLVWRSMLPSLFSKSLWYFFDAWGLPPGEHYSKRPQERSW